MVRMRMVRMAFGRHQFEPKRDVITRRDPPLSFFGEIFMSTASASSLPTELMDLGVISTTVCRLS